MTSGYKGYANGKDVINDSQAAPPRAVVSATASTTLPACTFPRRLRADHVRMRGAKRSTPIALPVDHGRHTKAQSDYGTIPASARFTTLCVAVIVIASIEAPSK